MKRIKNDHVLRLLAVEETTDHIKLYTEYCSLGDLAIFIKNEKGKNSLGGIPAYYVFSFLKQLASALHVMREMNLVHRDLKPQNILLSNKQVNGSLMGGSAGTEIVLKLGDFGFARVLSGEQMAETLCGSPLYMAPEILRYEKYDAKADLWSVGIILYEMICGRTPFKAQNHLALIKKIQMTKNVLFPDESPENKNYSGSQSHPIKIPSSSHTMMAFSSPSELQTSRNSKGSNENLASDEGFSKDLRSLTRGLLKKDPMERLSFEEFFLNSCVRLGTDYINIGSKENIQPSINSLPQTVQKHSVSLPSSSSSQASSMSQKNLRRVNSSTYSTYHPSPVTQSQEEPFHMEDVPQKRILPPSLNTTEQLQSDTSTVWSPDFPNLSLPFANTKIELSSSTGTVIEAPKASKNSPVLRDSGYPRGNEVVNARRESAEIQKATVVSMAAHSLGAVAKIVVNSAKGIISLGYPSFEDQDDGENMDPNKDDTEKDGYVFIKANNNY